jgi:hypothetical protein
MSKPNFRPIAPLDVDDEALDRVNDRLNVPVMVRSPAAAQQPSRSAVDTPSRRAAKAASRQTKLTLRVPDYLVDALKRSALDRRTTLRALVLQALQRDGYAVKAEDLLPGAGGSD